MSTTSDIAPSRPSISDQPPSQGSGPIPLFDAHIKLLTDSYLNFFLERKKIEEVYIDSLLRLHRKTKQYDSCLEDRIDPKNTTRQAWAEVRDNVEREADTRGAFVNTLTTDVINPLIIFKETQERIRKRIRENLKEAYTAHAEYLENVYPKLKRSYHRKAQEFEELKSASNAPPQSPTATADSHHGHSKANPSGAPSRPVVTAPQPLRPLDRRPSGTIPTTRQRSPSSSTPFQDFAHQGKKQLNQLMTFLDKDKQKDRSEAALKNVRAKREAEEADKEYRKSVHWLETLRLRRVKILESGYNSLEMLVRESAETVKLMLAKYTDNQAATSITHTQLCGHVLRFVDNIDPDKDASFIAQSIPTLLSSAIPKPVYYHNYNVGECRDLVFGVGLVDYSTSRGLPDGEVPKIVRICIREIENRGLESEGIYRVSGRHAAVQDLQHKIERNEAAFQFNPAHDDVYAVSSLLKLYLRELPEPVFRFPMEERIHHTSNIDEHISNDFQLLRSKIRRLPPVHQATLKAIVEHLARIASYSEKNKMDPKNLAIVFGSVIFGEDEIPKVGDLLSVQAWKDSLMEDLITHAIVLFRISNSPPLPPAPLNEFAAQITYGSQYTRVSAMPPPNSTPPSPQPSRRNALNVDTGPTAQSVLTPRSAPPMNEGPRPPSRSGALPPPPPHEVQQQQQRQLQRQQYQQQQQQPEDFTPQLPPRPTIQNSIHPSLRAGPLSSIPGRQSLPPPPRSGQWFEEGNTQNLSGAITPSTSGSSTSTLAPPPPHANSLPISSGTGNGMGDKLSAWGPSANNAIGAVASISSRRSRNGSSSSGSGSMGPSPPPSFPSISVSNDHPRTPVPISSTSSASVMTLTPSRRSREGREGLGVGNSGVGASGGGGSNASSSTFPLKSPWSDKFPSLPDTRSILVDDEAEPSLIALSLQAQNGGHAGSSNVVDEEDEHEHDPKHDDLQEIPIIEPPSPPSPQSPLSVPPSPLPTQPQSAFNLPLVAPLKLRKRKSSEEIEVRSMNSTVSDASFESAFSNSSLHPPPESEADSTVIGGGDLGSVEEMMNSIAGSSSTALATGGEGGGPAAGHAKGASS